MLPTKLAKQIKPTSATKREVRSSYEYVEGWGMTVGGYSRLLHPRSTEDILASYNIAYHDGVGLGLRGSGNSYGDASVNEGGHVLDISEMNRFLDWNPETGVAEVEPGVTVEQLWKRILADGWWPKVVPGTMFPTLAGACAANIHGKNNFAVGTIGESTLEFDIVLPTNEVRTCSRTQNTDLFYAAIGSFGMLGCFSRLVLQTKKVHSGDLWVRTVNTRNLREMMDYFELNKSNSDYLVGWVDCFPSDASSGRGLIHQAHYMRPGEDAHPEKTLSLSHQELPPNIFGVFPRSEMWRVLQLFNHDPGMRFINAVKYFSATFDDMRDRFKQSHASFAFLLDYVPNWKWAYGRKPRRFGLIQYQPFLPDRVAHDVYLDLLSRCRKADLVPYLGVLKRHRSDPFWLTHAVDGWSFAMDFAVTPSNRNRLWKHCAEMTRVVLEAEGRFYFAKDLVIGSDDAQRFFPADKLEAFRHLKRECDPEQLLVNNFTRRVFPER